MSFVREFLTPNIIAAGYAIFNPLPALSATIGHDASWPDAFTSHPIFPPGARSITIAGIEWKRNPLTEGHSMRYASLALVALLLAGLVALPASAQNNFCKVDLSEVSALLTRAQAASSSGDPASALALVNRADALLATLENRCDLPVVTPDVALGDAVTAPDGFTVSLPAGWVADAETAAASGGFLIGSTAEAARTMADAEPALAPGQAGMLIAYGTPADVSFGTLRSGDLEAVTRFFQIALGSTYLLEGDPAYIQLGGRPAAELGFTGGDFEGHVIILEAAPGQYAVVAASAPRGELNALIPTVQAVAASITPAAQEG